MWERIGASSSLIIGAAVLFIIFTAVLFVFEKKSEKKRTSGKAQRKLYVVPPVKKDKAA